MMHASNANLSNSLTNCFYIIPSNSPKRTQFRQCVRQICPRWDPKTFLEPVQTKKFFITQHQLHIMEIFADMSPHYPIRWPDTQIEFILPVSQVVALLFDSLRIFHQFSYTQWPTRQDFHTLECARGALLGTYAGMKWRLRPTMHYTTNEGMEFAKRDGRMYHTLNEGPEQEHKEVKQLANKTLKHVKVKQTGDTTYTKIIDNQQVMRSLRDLGYGPTEFKLVDTSLEVPTPQLANITPLKYLPM